MPKSHTIKIFAGHAVTGWEGLAILTGSSKSIHTTSFHHSEAEAVSAVRRWALTAGYKIASPRKKQQA